MKTFDDIVNVLRKLIEVVVKEFIEERLVEDYRIFCHLNEFEDFIEIGHERGEGFVRLG